MTSFFCLGVLKLNSTLLFFISDLYGFLKSLPVLTFRSRHAQDDYYNPPPRLWLIKLIQIGKKIRLFFSFTITKLHKEDGVFLDPS